MAKMRVSSPGARALLIVVGVLVFCLFGFLSYRDYRAVKAEQAQIREMNEAIKRAEQKIAQVRGLRAQVEELRASFESDRKILPEHPGLEEFIVTLQEFRSECNIPSGSADPLVSTAAAKTATPSVEEKSWRLRFESAFFPFARFINLLESSERLIRVDSFTILSRPGPAAAREAEDRSEVELQVTTFMYRPPAPPAPAQRPAQAGAPRK